MKKVVFWFIGVFIFGCNTSVQPSELTYLTGYWAIEEAISPEGEKRPYIGVVEAEYFELDNLTGFRKKAVPLPSGGFNVTKDATPFTIKFTKNTCLIAYKKNNQQWEEKIVRVSEDKLELEDARGVVFRYKKYIP